MLYASEDIDRCVLVDHDAMDSVVRKAPWSCVFGLGTMNVESDRHWMSEVLRSAKNSGVVLGEGVSGVRPSDFGKEPGLFLFLFTAITRTDGGQWSEGRDLWSQ